MPPSIVGGIASRKTVERQRVPGKPIGTYGGRGPGRRANRTGFCVKRLHSLAQYFLLRRYVFHVRPFGRWRRSDAVAVAADAAARRRRSAASVVVRAAVTHGRLVLSLFHVAHGRIEYQHLARPENAGRHVCSSL